MMERRGERRCQHGECQTRILFERGSDRGFGDPALRPSRVESPCQTESFPDQHVASSPDPLGVPRFRWGGTEVFYLLYEDRIVYQKLPDQEVITMEDVREIQKVPMEYLPGQDSKQAFCLVLSLINGRELRLQGFLNLAEAWDFLSARLPGRITDWHAVPKSVELLTARQVLWFGSGAPVHRAALRFTGFRRWSFPATGLRVARGRKRQLQDRWQ